MCVIMNTMLPLPTCIIPTTSNTPECLKGLLMDVHILPDRTKAFNFKGFLFRGDLMLWCLIFAEFYTC